MTEPLNTSKDNNLRDSIPLNAENLKSVDDISLENSQDLKVNSQKGEIFQAPANQPGMFRNRVTKGISTLVGITGGSVVKEKDDSERYLLKAGYMSQFDDTVSEEMKALEEYFDELFPWTGEEIEIISKGNSLEGWMCRSTHTPTDGVEKHTVLILSGSHQSTEFYTSSMVAALTDQGHDVLVFNYEGFGDSEGKASDKNLVADAEAALLYLMENEDKYPIACLGYSLGSLLATDLACKYDIPIILDHPMANPSQAAKDQTPGRSLPFLGKLVQTIAGGILGNGIALDNLSRIQEIISHNLMIVGGKGDTQLKEDTHYGPLMEVAKTMSEYNPKELNYLPLEVEGKHEHRNLAETLWKITATWAQCDSALYALQNGLELPGETLLYDKMIAYMEKRDFEFENRKLSEDSFVALKNMDENQLKRFSFELARYLTLNEEESVWMSRDEGVAALNMFFSTNDL